MKLMKCEVDRREILDHVWLDSGGYAGELTKIDTYIISSLGMFDVKPILDAYEKYEDNLNV